MQNLRFVPEEPHRDARGRLVVRLRVIVPDPARLLAALKHPGADADCASLRVDGSRVYYEAAFCSKESALFAARRWVRTTRDGWTRAERKARRARALGAAIPQGIARRAT